MSAIQQQQICCRSNCSAKMKAMAALELPCTRYGDVFSVARGMCGQSRISWKRKGLCLQSPAPAASGKGVSILLQMLTDDRSPRQGQVLSMKTALALDSTNLCMQFTLVACKRQDVDPASYLEPGQRSHSVAQVKNANAILPYAVVGTAFLAFTYPPSFTWFSTGYYAPALGYLMFAVGINLSVADFAQVLRQPGVIALGYAGQFVLKPLLGLLLAAASVSGLHLPEAMGSGLLLMSCVSGAQLSNYATYLVAPNMAPLSIVMTALSTATAVFVTPALTLLLLGRRLPVDVLGMVRNISQIVLVPIAAGLLLNRFAPRFTRFIKLFLPALSVLVTCLCVGSPLAFNIKALRSWDGVVLLVPVLGFHAVAFLLGYNVPHIVLSAHTDVDDLAKAISLETGMQSSLLSLALANTFFRDPLVGVASAVSVVSMTLMGFGLATYWNKQKPAVMCALAGHLNMEDISGLGLLRLMTGICSEKPGLPGL